MVSMKDVAAACGVSVATVSKALSNHRDIGEKTRKLVKETAEQMGYLPNQSARYLKDKSKLQYWRTVRGCSRERSDT